MTSEKGGGLSGLAPHPVFLTLSAVVSPSMFNSILESREELLVSEISMASSYPTPLFIF